MQREYLIRISWPPEQLRSNAKVRWRKKVDATKAHRTEAYWAGRERGLHKDPDPNAILSIAYHPPCNRKRDIHNMPTACKALIDGIADAMGVDDNKFDVRWPSKFAEPVKGGCILVHVRGAEDITQVPYRGRVV